MTDIQYPEAFEKPYRRVHVSALTRHARGGPYYCFGCDQEMVARLGEVKVHHFAHKSQRTTKCDPDNALHRAAQANILEGFSEAIEKEKPYNAGIPCTSKGCADTVKFNIATSGSRIFVERSVVQGTRADLVVYSPDGNGTTWTHLIIEVVVTHDLEPHTYERYEAANIPVIKIKPVWDSLEELRTAVVGYDTVNIPAAECEYCKAVREEEEAQKRQEADNRHREEAARESIRIKYERAQQELRKLREAEKLEDQHNRTGRQPEASEEQPIEARKPYIEQERIRAQRIRDEERRIEEKLQLSEDTPLATKLRALSEAQRDGTVWRQADPK